MSDKETTRYHVRQYRPAFFSGFENEVIRDVPYEGILEAPWCENFKHDDFDHFSISKYGNGELIVEAHYKSGEHWVVGFAIDSAHPFASDWRYENG